MKKFFKWSGVVILIVISLVLIILGSFYKSDIPTNENEEKYFTPESEYIEIEGNRIHLRRKGSGLPVLLIHGSFSSLHTWEVWQEKLSGHFTTIAIDLPGHGLTGTNSQERYDTDYNATLLWKLMNKLEYDSVAIAGNSMGGQVAYKMALQKPEKVVKMILLNASGAHLAADTTKFKDKNSFSVFSLINHPIFSEMMTSITPKFLFEMSMKQVYYDESKITDERLQLYYDLMLHEGNRAATVKRFKQRSPSDFRKLSDLQTPTLIMWGQHDSWIPVSHAYRFDSILQNSSLQVYPNAGHVPMEEIPVETASDALEFLQIP